MRVDCDAGLLEAEPRHVRTATDGEHHLIGSNAAPVGELRGEFAAAFVDLLNRHAGADSDAALLHFGAQMRAHVIVEAAQDVVAAIDERHRGAQPGEDARELNGDIAAALDHNALRHARADETLRSRR